MPGGIPNCKRILDDTFEYKKWPSGDHDLVWFDYAKIVCTKRVSIDEQLSKKEVPEDISLPKECEKSLSAERFERDWRKDPYKFGLKSDGTNDYDWKTFLEAFEDTCDHLKQIKEKVTKGELPQGFFLSPTALLGGVGGGIAGLGLIPLIRKLITFF